jgi:hypothetical protein
MPETGRFTGKDPFKGDGLNLYVYVKSNPMRFVDPSGFCAAEGGEIVDQSPLDVLREWLQSNEPLVGFEIPSAGDVISKLGAALAGTGSGAISSVEKSTDVFINEKGVVQFYPAGSDVKVRPFKKMNKVGTVMMWSTFSLDVGNTWTADSGNTRLERIEKSAIQAVGAGIAYYVGANVTGPLVATGVVGAPETSGVSLILVIAAVGVDTGAAWLIEKGQQQLYEWMEIK